MWGMAMIKKEFRMKKKILIVLGLVLMSGVAYAVSEAVNPEPVTYSWRYKMTVEIDTPEGLKSGSAVREVTMIINPPEFDAKSPRIETKVRGEAVVVDLGERGVVFALLKGGPVASPDHAKQISQKLFPNPRNVDLVDYYKENFDQLKGKPKTLADEQHPLMVTFKDVNDPKSITLVRSVKSTQESTFVNPEYVTKDHFEEFFGKGVQLRKVNIELTDEEVTKGISKKLIWFNDFKDNYLHGGFTSRGAPLGLHGGNFKQGNDYE